MPKKVISPKLAEKTHAWYGATWDNPNQGVQYTLESFPELYRRALAGMRGVFSAGELSLIIDALNGTMLTAGMAGQHIIADCEDGINMDDLGKKWKIETSAFLKRLRGRSNFELATLEIWAGAFWRQKEKSSEDWIMALAKEK